MKISIQILLVLTFLIVTSCDDIIEVDLESSTPLLVVDAFISNQDTLATISLFKSQDYFDNSKYEAVSSAQISILENETGFSYIFIEDSSNPGFYHWKSDSTNIGLIGNSYTLRIFHEGDSFIANSNVNRVPSVDSILININDGFLGGSEFYEAEFFANDIPGKNDTYWIKTFKNNQFLNRPSEINLAYDSGPNSGIGLDGIPFAPPIRLNINPVGDEDSDGNRLTYSIGDKIKVEIHSIDLATYEYLSNLSIQTNRPGGFQELFSQPIANLRTNIFSTNNEESEVLGFFSMSAVSSNEITFTEDMIRN